MVGPVQRAAAKDDHLCFVAGIQRHQIKELRTQLRVDTLEKLGDLAIVPKPTRGSREALERVRDQAAIQLRARRLNAPQHEVLPLKAEHGVLLLPRPSARDLFLDLEGDRLALEGGREYLFGVSDVRGAYAPLWATNPAEEKVAFERVVDRILEVFRADPAMHVYHFGGYEPTAFKRLSGRYATRETELDTILRAELFVDLHTIVRHSLKASVETYSLKDLEQFYGLTRAQDLREATASRRALEWAIEMREDLGTRATNDPASASPERPQLELSLDAIVDDDASGKKSEFAAHVAIVERYNREDCVSAAALRDWLEGLRAAAERAAGEELDRPPLKSGEANEHIAATAEETQRIMIELLANIPVDPAERTPEQQGRWLMAHLLEWHRREEKAAWWEYYRLLELPLEDYAEERSTLSGLKFVATVGGTARRPQNRDAVPPPDQDIRKKDEVCVPPHGAKIGDIEALDLAAHTIDILQTSRYAGERPSELFVRRNVPAGAKPAVLLEIGRWIAAHGIDSSGEYRAARDLILRLQPRFLIGAQGLAPEPAPGPATDA
jgi:uncharacterized protein